ncbi:MAG: tetratricopeptide repeat protein [Chloroflexota bacterium]
MNDGSFPLPLLRHSTLVTLSKRLICSLFICTLLLLSSDMTHPLFAQSHDDYMDDGKAAFNEGDYETALELFNLAVETDPSDAFAYGYRGNTLWYLRQYDEAIANFDQAVELNPKYSGAFLLRGRTYYRLNEYDQALVDLSRAIALDREYDYAFGIRAEVYVDLEEYDKALDDLDRAIDIEPEYYWAYAKRADVNRILGNYDEAIEDATQSMEISPEYDWAYAVRGNIYQELDEYDNAVDDFTKAIELRPDYDWAFAQRASVYQDLGEYRRAIDDYTAAIEIDPEYTWALAGRGKTYQKLDEYAKSIADFNRALRLSPDYEWAIAQRGLTYFYMEEYEKSILDFDRAIELDPNDGWNYAQRGDSYRHIDELEKALADFNKSIELDPEYVWVLAQRGKLLSQLDRYEEALEDLDKALTLSPDSEWIFEIRGEVHQAMGNTDAAIADFNRSAGLDPDTTSTPVPTPVPSPTPRVLPRAQASGSVFGPARGQSSEDEETEPEIKPETEPETELDTGTETETSDLVEAGPETEPEISTTTIRDTPSDVDSYLNAEAAVIQIEATGSYQHPYDGAQINMAGRGSGVIVDPSGIAVTNAHVVMGAAILNVNIAGEARSRNARILGVDPCRDLAVIQISGDELPYLDWHSGPTTTGMDVYAAGFPLGDPEYTLMSGIVARSRTDGHTQFSALDDVIMHDATILPGNSGGPLLTKDGRIVGINYMGNSRLSRYYAIPYEVAQEITSRLREGTDIDSVGINGEVLMTDDGESLGIWVASVDSGSPASRSGIKAGDIVYSIEGIRLDSDTTMGTYCEILRSHDPSDIMTVAIYRPSTKEEMAGELNGEKLQPLSGSGPATTNSEPDSGPSSEPDSGETEPITSTGTALQCDADTDPEFADFVVMTDQFSNDENGWAAETESETMDSRNTVEGGKLIRTSTFRGNVLGFTGISELSLANFWFCIQAQVMEADAKDNGLVFIFRATESYDSYYAFSVSGYGDYLMQRKIDGEWETIQKWTEDDNIDLTVGKTNRFDLIGNGPKITFAVNNEIIAEIEDSAIAEAGILAFGTLGSEDTEMTVAFDDLVVLGFDNGSASNPTPTRVAALPTATPLPPTPIPPTPTPQSVAAVAVVNVPTLNVRSGPGTGNGIVGSLSQGSRVVVIGRADAGCSWIQIQIPTGGTGWVAGTAQFTTLEGDCGRLPQPNVTITRGTGGGGGSGQGCIHFENHFGAEANVTLNRPSDGWNKTWKIAGKAKHTECMPPGKYTYTVDVPPPWGSINGDFEMGAGDSYSFPIYGQ